jgi:3-hydroxyacyl-[acyl-carrier-protein] dehydratase
MVTLHILKGIIFISIQQVKDEIQGRTTLYTGIDKVRFKNPVKPGDLCEVTASLKNRRGSIFYCTATLKVNGNICSKGDLSFALV